MRPKASHMEYQEFCKAEATHFSCLIRDTGLSMNKASKEMKNALLAKGVDIHPTTCTMHIKASLNNNCVGISPQKTGGVALPSSIEKEIGKMVEVRRERDFPVFPEEVIKWAAVRIEGTQYADYFQGGIPTRGW